MLITKQSLFSGNITSMELAITDTQLRRWKVGGEKIQCVFPHLSADEREFLMTGITPTEWEDEFKQECDDDGEG